MALSKTQTWEQVQALIVEFKINKKAAEALEALLSPKAGGGISPHPHQLDENGNIVAAWCKYHERYEDIEDMVVSNELPKGYCKAAASKSNKLRKQTKDMEQRVIQFMADGSFDEAQKVAMEAKALSTQINHPSLYNYEEDWAEFRKPKDAE